MDFSVWLCYNEENKAFFGSRIMINVSNLNKVYKGRKCDHHALKDVCLTLPDRGLVFVLGKSGSGKSTLLNIISGIVKNYNNDFKGVENG